MNVPNGILSFLAEVKHQRKQAVRQAREAERREKRQAKSQAKQARKASVKGAAKGTPERKAEQKIKAQLNRTLKDEKRRTRMLPHIEKLEAQAIKLMSEAKRLRSTYELLTKQKEARLHRSYPGH